MRRVALLGLLAACTPRGTDAPGEVVPAGPTSAPSQVAAIAKVAVAAGLQHSCAAIDGQVYCWGYNGHGELGDGTLTDRRTPAPVPGLRDATAVVAGGGHSCALRATGTVVCWGDGAHGQLGDGGRDPRPTWVQVQGLAGISALAAGSWRTCALGQAGAVWCWGGQFSDGAGDSVAASTRPVAVAGLAPATAIAVADDYACAVVAGAVLCWGMRPPLLAAITPDDPPAAVPGIADGVAVAVGRRHACARTTAGEVLCWGEGREGQRGDGVVDPAPGPWRGPRPPPGPAPVAAVAKVVGLRDVVDISAGSDSTCARSSDGALACWGANRDGQLGDGGSAPRATPVTPTLGSAADLSLGSAHACAALRDGAVWCWGYNDVGQADNRGSPDPRRPYLAIAAPDGRTDMSDAPGRNGQVLSGMSEVTAAVGAGHVCAALRGRVRCVGDNAYGQLGDGTRTLRASAVTVAGIDDAVQVVAGPRHTCARRAGGRVMCWGDDSFGQLGQPGAPPGEPRDEHGMSPPPPPPGTYGRATPVEVAGLSDAQQLATRGHETCALQVGGAVRCWHDGGATPLRLDAQLPADAAELGLGAAHRCARRTGGEVLCWGSNFYGRVGDGTHVDRPQPTPVRALADAVALAAGRLHTCAARRGGAAVCWGSGFGGLLGDGSEAERAAPVAVAGLRDAVAIAAGEDHTCALRQAGEVACWGRNSRGALGDGGTGDRLVPVAVAQIAGATSIAAGEQVSCAALRGGEVQCWGRDLRVVDAPNVWDVARVPAPIAGLPTR